MGKYTSSKRVAGEMREIDVFFAPSSQQLTRLVTVLFLENYLQHKNNTITYTKNAPSDCALKGLILVEGVI